MPRSITTRLCWGIVVLLVAYGTISIAIGCRNSFRYSQDLAPIYVGARAWLSALNPYSPDVVRTVASSAKLGDAEVTVYPPPALVVASPIAVVNWTAARVLWAAMNVVLLLVCFALMQRNALAGRGALETAMFFGVWLSGIGIRVLIANGQHSLLIFFFALISVDALRRNRDALGGLGAGLTAYKFTWTPFFAILLMASRKKVRAPLVAVAVPVALLLIFAIRLDTQAPEAFVGYWLQIVDLSRVVDRDPGVGFSSVYPLFAAITGRPIALLMLWVMIVVAFVLLVRIALRSTITPELFAAISLFCLWAIYHYLYDEFLLFVPLVALWRARSNPKRTVRFIGWALMALSIVFWFVDPARVATAFAAGGHQPAAKIACDALFRFTLIADFVFLISREICGVALDPLPVVTTAPQPR